MRDIMVHYSRQPGAVGAGGGAAAAAAGAAAVRPNMDSFVWYHPQTGAPGAVNYKLNVEMVFSAAKFENLMKAFFAVGGDAASKFTVYQYKQLVQKKHNPKIKKNIDLHASVRALSANLNVNSDYKFTRSQLQNFPPKLLEALTDRGVPGTFTDNGGVVYDLYEVGIAVGLFKKPGGVIVYDRNYNNVEIKYAQRGDTNKRVMINVHFKHDKNITKPEDGVKTLDELIARVQEDAVKDELQICKRVTPLNLEGYTVPKYSHQYFERVLPLYTAYKISTLDIANTQMAKQILVLEGDKAGMAARIEALEDLVGQFVQTFGAAADATAAADAPAPDIAVLEAQVASLVQTRATAFGLFAQAPAVPPPAAGGASVPGSSSSDSG